MTGTQLGSHWAVVALHCLRGRRGTWRHRPSLCVAGVALGDIDVHFCVAGVALMALGWLWWRAWFPVGAVVARGCLRGRRGTWRHRRAFCVAGVALGDIDVHFCVAGVALWRNIDVHSAWQAWHFTALGWLWWRAWHLRHWAVSRLFAWQAWCLAISTSTLRGRPGAWRHRRTFCVAGVALGDIDVHSAWQAWRLATSTRILRGRCGTYGTGLALVAHLVPTPLSPWLFAWQAWHSATSTCTWRGRRGALRHRHAFCVAGVALDDIDVHSAWQV